MLTLAIQAAVAVGGAGASEPRTPAPFASMSPSISATRPAAAREYLFAYFTGNGEDGLHLAASRDGLKWERLNGGQSYLAPAVGHAKLMRAPCVLAAALLGETPLQH